MILKREEFKTRLQERFGESDKEEDISFLEDLTDTFDSLDASGPVKELEDIKTKYNDLLKKYRDRFFEKGSEPSEPELEDPEPVETEVKKYRFDELFTEE